MALTVWGLLSVELQLSVMEITRPPLEIVHTLTSVTPADANFSQLSGVSWKALVFPSQTTRGSVSWIDFSPLVSSKEVVTTTLGGLLAGLALARITFAA